MEKHQKTYLKPEQEKKEKGEGKLGPADKIKFMPGLFWECKSKDIGQWDSEFK